MGTRKANRDFPGQRAQPERALYGGRLTDVDTLRHLYTSDCAGPYVLQLNAAGTRMVDAYDSRDLLSMANHGKVGVGAGRQANMNFSPPPSNNSIRVTAVAREAVYHGDQMFAHYSDGHNLSFVDRQGNLFNFETA